MRTIMCVLLVSASLAGTNLYAQAAGSAGAGGTGGGAAGPATGGAAGIPAGNSAGNPIGSAGPASASEVVPGGRNDIATGAPGFRANDREINAAGPGGAQRTPSAVDRSLPASGSTPGGAGTPEVFDPNRK